MYEFMDERLERLSSMCEAQLVICINFAYKILRILLIDNCFLFQYRIL